MLVMTMLSLGERRESFFVFLSFKLKKKNLKNISITLAVSRHIMSINNHVMLL
jgi:hypothetical protein